MWHWRSEIKSMCIELFIVRCCNEPNKSLLKWKYIHSLTTIIISSGIFVFHYTVSLFKLHVFIDFNNFLKLGLNKAYINGFTTWLTTYKWITISWFIQNYYTLFLWPSTSFFFKLRSHYRDISCFDYMYNHSNKTGPPQ